MLLSTFELLLKDITPAAGNITNSNRKILQGYFLTVSNPNNVSLNLRLRFNATSPPLNASQLIVIRDTGGSNDFGSLASGNIYDFRLDANDTGLVILQPDILNLDPDVDIVEFRGYVEVFIRQRFPFPGFPSRPLLFTPEHRGTFLPNAGETEFDQLFTAVPTAMGASLMNVDVILDPPIFEGPILPSPTVPAISPTLPVISGDDVAGLQQALGAMAQTIEDLRQQVNARR